MPTIARGRVGNSSSTLRATRRTPRPSPGQTKKELRDSSLRSATDAGRQKAWSGSDPRRCGAQDYVLTTRSLLGILFAKFLKYLSSFLEKIFSHGRGVRTRKRGAPWAGAQAGGCLGGGRGSSGLIVITLSGWESSGDGEVFCEFDQISTISVRIRFSDASSVFFSLSKALVNISRPLSPASFSSLLRDWR